MDSVLDSVDLRVSVGLQAGERLYEYAHHAGVGNRGGKTEWRMEHAAASQDFARQAGGAEADSGRREVSVHLVFGYGDRVLPGGRCRRIDTRRSTGKIGKGFWVHVVSNAIRGVGDFGDAGTGVRHEIFGD